MDTFVEFRIHVNYMLLVLKRWKYYNNIFGDIHSFIYQIDRDTNLLGKDSQVAGVAEDVVEDLLNVYQKQWRSQEFMMGVWDWY